MIPHTLTLEGFIGIRDGRGLDAITIDCDALLDGAELVALVGANGSGKTTILDNLHPYRLMPSRASSYSPDAFSFYEHVGPQAKKVLEWSFNGNRYRSECTWRQTGKTKKAEAVLYWQLPAGDWLPYQCTDGTVSDGKTRTYDACVEEVLGSPETYFTGVFAAQSRRPVGEYGNADIKALMSDILGLDHLADLAARAGEVLTLLRAQYKALEPQAMRSAQLAGEVDAAAQAEAACGNAYVEAVAVHDDRRRALDSARSELARTEAAAGELSWVGERRANLEARRNSLRDEYTSTRTDFDGRIERERRRQTEVDTDLQSQITASQERERRLAGRVDGYTKTLAEGEAIRAAVEQLPALEAAEAEAHAAYLRAVSAYDEGDQQARERERLAFAVREAEAVCQRIEERVQAATQASERMGSVPCADMSELQSTCPLLAAAREAHESLLPLANEQSAARAELQKATEAVANAPQPDIAALQAAQRKAKEAAERATQALLVAQRLADRAEALDIAERDRAAAQADLEAERELLDRLVARQTEARAEGQAAIEELETARDSKLAALQAEGEKVAAELEDLPSDQTEALEQAKAKVDTADQALAEAQSKVDAARTAQAEAAARFKALEQEKVAADAAAVRYGELGTDIEHWRQLQIALGPNGIVALSLDDAGPAITAIANQLLHECFGAEFSVSIHTQRETQSGTTRETFEVRVHDASGESRPLSAMSGGQRVWMNEAITRAICLFQAQNTGRQYGLLISDESDGPLDPERKRHFMRMKRAVLKAGGYSHELCVTHTHDLLDEADRVVHIEDIAA